MTDNVAIDMLVGPFHDLYFGRNPNQGVELSIIVPCYQGRHLTQMTLNAISYSILPEKTELIVIDDGSTDDTTEFITQTYSDIVTCLIKHRDNSGFPVSVNQGIALSTGRYIAIFNNDLIVPNNWWVSIKEAFDNNPTLDAGGKSYKTGALSTSLISHGTTFFYPPNEKTYDEWTQHNLGIKEPDSGNVTPMRMGCPWVFKREVFEEVGTFDERFSPGTWEDIDLWLRIFTSGWNLGTIGNCYAYHFHSQTMSVHFPEIRQIYNLNKKKLCEKWGFNVPEDELPNIDWEQCLVTGEMVVLNHNEVVNGS